MKRIGLGILILTLVISLNGCSSKEDKGMKNFLKCSIVAKELGKYRNMEIIDKKMKVYLKNNESYFKAINNLNRYFVKLNEEVKNDEIGLYKYNTRGKIKILQEIYTSNECRELYK